MCNFVIGNSSSGIIEVPALENTINLGLRQKGRIHAKSVSCPISIKMRLKSKSKRY